MEAKIMRMENKYTIEVDKQDVLKLQKDIANGNVNHIVLGQQTYAIDLFPIKGQDFKYQVNIWDAAYGIKGATDGWCIWTSSLKTALQETFDTIPKLSHTPEEDVIIKYKDEE